MPKQLSKAAGAAAKGSRGVRMRVICVVCVCACVPFASRFASGDRSRSRFVVEHGLTFRFITLFCTFACQKRRSKRVKDLRELLMLKCGVVVYGMVLVWFLFSFVVECYVVSVRTLQQGLIHLTLGCSTRVLAFARARGGGGARSPTGSGDYAQEPEAEDVTRGANRNANIVVHRARGRAQPASRRG
jgi:hypothetical protein